MPDQVRHDEFLAEGYRVIRVHTQDTASNGSKRLARPPMHRFRKSSVRRGAVLPPCARVWIVLHFSIQLCILIVYKEV